MKPANVAKFVAQSFSLGCPTVRAALEASTLEKIVKLEKADVELQKSRA